MRRPGHKRRPRLYVKAVKPVGGLPGGGSFPMRFASSQGDPSFPPGVGFLLCVSTAAGDGGVWVGPVTSAGCAVEAAVLLC